jgi:hypothetical protein
VTPASFLAHAILVFGALVVVQLAWWIAGRGVPTFLARLFARVRVLGVLAALGLAWALFRPGTPEAVGLSGVWVGIGLVSAGLAVLRFATRERRFDLPEIAIDFGLGYLAVGAVWAFVYRANLSLVGFSGTQALLTANHFHFAGLGASVLVGALGRLGPVDRLWKAGGLGTVFSIALVAVGISLSRAVELIAAWTLVACILVTAVVLLRAARRARDPRARVLLGISSLAGVTPALLAVHFAWGGFAELREESFHRMVLWHGLFNAVGFVGAGLAGVSLELRRR